MNDELSRDRAHEHKDEPVAHEPVRHAQGDPRHPQDLERQAVPRVVVERGREPAVVVELLRFELVQREDDRKALAPERDQRSHERDVAEDPRLVLDDHRIALRRNELELAIQIARVEMLDPDEGDLMAAVAEAIGHGERVVVDAAALVARHDDDLLRLRVGQLPSPLSERELQPVGDVRSRERIDPAATLFDQVLAKCLIVDDAFELRGDRLRRFRFEQDAAVAERLGDRSRGVRDDRKVAPHRFEKRNAEALVLGQRQERGRTAVIRDELLDRDAAGEGDRALETEPANVAADAIEVAAGHRGRTDEIKMRRAIGLPIFGERGDDVVDRLMRKDLPHGEDRGPLVGELARDGSVGRPIEVIPGDERRHDGSVRQACLFELLPVVLAVGDSELNRFR